MKNTLKSYNSFFIFLVAAFFSQFSEGIFNIVCILLLTKLGHTYLAIGYMFVLVMLPSVFVQPLLGPIIDRYNKAKISSLLTFLRSIFIGIIPTWWILFGPSIYPIYISILLSYIIYHFLSSTNDSMMSELSNDNSKKLSKIIAIAQGTLQVGLLSSSIVAGLLMELFNMYVPILLTIIMYLFSSLLFLSIKNKFNTINTTIEPLKNNNDISYIHQITKTIKFITSRKYIFILTFLVAIPLPFFASINTLLSPANIQLFNGNSLTLGVIDSFAGVGSLIATLLVVYLHKLKPISLVITSLIFLGITLVIFPFSIYVFLASILYLCMGLFMGFIKIYSRSLVYDVVPEKMIGKVFSLWTSVSLLIASAMSIIMGILANYHILFAYIILGIIFVFIGMVYIYLTVYKKIKIVKEKG